MSSPMPRSPAFGPTHMSSNLHIDTPQHYQTFPTKPPSGKGRPPSNIAPDTISPPPTFRGRRASRLSHRSIDEFRRRRQSDAHSGYGGGVGDGKTPAPTRQLIVLAVISLAEQTALNSIAPYLPDMARGFPEVDPLKAGLYVGIIASCFAAAQVTSNFFWGRLSDRIGRKPVILWGTFWTAIGFLMFGCVRTLWQAALVQAFIGLVNGNQGVVSTVLGEITDKSNQSTSFSYLPVIYGVGSILGPLMGGLLVGNTFLVGGVISHNYPYLLPNLFAATLLLADFVISMIYLEESLEQAQYLQPLSTRVKSLFVWVWQFTAGAARPGYLKLRGEQNLHEHHHHHPHSHHTHPTSPQRTSTLSTPSTPSHNNNSPIPTLFPSLNSEEDQETATLSYNTILKTPVLLLLISFFIFNLSNITFASLYPIYVSELPPLGAGLSPKEIGLTISISGVAAILLQVGLFTRLQDRMGNKHSFRLSILALAVSFFAMPLIGGGQAKGVTMVEISSIALVKSVAMVVGLTASMLMFTNASPDNKVLGRINGLAQTLSAAGRAVGPLMSGGLWSLALEVGEGKTAGRGVAWLAWGVFGAVTAVGAGVALGIRGGSVESEDDAQGGDEESRRGSGSGSGSGSAVVDDEEDGEGVGKRRGSGTGSGAGSRGGSVRSKAGSVSGSGTGTPVVGGKSIGSPRRMPIGYGERESLLRPSSFH